MMGSGTNDSSSTMRRALCGARGLGIISGMIPLICIYKYMYGLGNMDILVAEGHNTWLREPRLNAGSKLCDGSWDDSQGWWQPLISGGAKGSADPLPLYDLWSGCGDDHAVYNGYVRNSSCVVLDLKTGIRKLGMRRIHVAGDSISHELYHSLKWLRRRSLLEDGLFGEKAGSLDLA
ncbi:unnamed protein product [Polarella glacialis]|uniref:Uncharacterized protein n=2 Tax=Polarella glacialis TaxID=89957 RepID=A0A813L403_POLGL|nr:unnamed protein product [Polarella glacialis]